MLTLEVLSYKMHLKRSCDDQSIYTVSSDWKRALASSDILLLSDSTVSDAIMEETDKACHVCVAITVYQRYHRLALQALNLILNVTQVDCVGLEAYIHL